MQSKFIYSNSKKTVSTNCIKDALELVLNSNTEDAALYVRADLVKEFKNEVEQNEAEILSANIECLNDGCGLCPKCRKPALGLLNVGRDHFCYCDEDQTFWHIGSNLFSGWRRESEDVWRANEEKLRGYRQVEPFYYTALVRGDWLFG